MARTVASQSDGPGEEGSPPGGGSALDGFALFLARLRTTPLLTAGQEIELARRIERGDDDARRRLVESNLRLVVSIAKTYRGRGLPFADLVQEGCVGLLRAADRYDWRLGFRFTTYATLWIRQAVGRSIANTGMTIRSPAHIVDLQPTLARVEQALVLRLAREPTPEEVRQETGLAVDTVRLVRRSRQDPLSLSAPAGAEGDHEIADLLVDAGGEGPETAGEAAWVRRAVARALGALSVRERAVVQLRFGLLDDEPMTLAAVGRRLGVTREGVRLIEARAFKKLEQSADVRRLRAG